MTPTTFAYPQPAAPARTPAHDSSDAATPRYRLGFFLFMLVNMALFMRPTEMFPEYFYSQTYLVLILACFVVSVPCVTKQLTVASLVEQPMSICVLGMTVAIMLSHLTRFALYDAIDRGQEFAKIALYYLLFLGLINTPSRLRQFLLWLVVFMLGQVTAAMLDYHGVVQLANFQTLKEEKFGSTVLRGIEHIYRLCGSGIFHNPNEICYPVGIAMIVCCFYLNGRSNLLRLFCLAALIYFGYAVTLTHSRGGFVGLMFALLGFLVARFGWRKAIPFAAVCLPGLFFLFAGRQTDLSTSSGTAQDRIQLWNQGLVDFLRNPLFGLGTGLFQQEAGLVAHNSYIQAFSELGFFGGTLFVGAYYIALSGLHRVGLCEERIVDPELRRLRPYLVAIVVGMMAWMVSMSLTDMIPVYSVVALSAAYLQMTAIRPPVPSLPRFDSRLVLRLAGVSALTLVFFRLYVWFTFVVG